MPLVLVAGCAIPTSGGDFCDTAEYIRFESDDTLEQIIAIDEGVVRGVVLNNEKLEKCP